MPFTLIDNVPTTSLPAIFSSAYTSLQTPRSLIHPIFFPLTDDGQTTPETSIQTAVDVQTAVLEASNSAHEVRWLQVVDTDSPGLVVGASLWHLFREDPFQAAGSERPKRGAPWQREGPDRAVIEEVFEVMGTGRWTWMRKPHLFLQFVFVRPEFRGKGLAQMMLKWGFEVADKEGWEIFLNASRVGLPLYEKLGFKAAPGVKISFDHLEQGNRMEELKALYLPETMWPMIRPVGGQFREGIDKMPWDA